jgi:hypothetical protein
MKKLLFIFIFLNLKLTSAQNSIAYCQKYPNHFYKACEWLSENRELADSIIKGFGLETSAVLAIGLPECGRFSSFSDCVESTSNYYLYSLLGSEYGNFSTGIFQMKPSFIENLEKEILRNDNLKQFRFCCDYLNSSDLKNIRRQRLSKIQTSKWQLIYLCALFTHLDWKYKNKTWISKTDKIKFIASAYNRGFNSEDKEIEKWINIPYFPNGKIDNYNNYPYGNVAVEFYNYLKSQNL